MPEPLRVLIAEDNVLMRAGIEALLGDEPDIDVVGTCTRYDELVREALRLRPDVVVTDIRMPPGFSDEGVRAAAQLREQAPAIGVVLLSQFLDPAYLLALIEPSSERRGYLLKDRVATPGQLATAVRTVATGGSYIDPLAVNTLVGAGRRRSASPLADLTVRDRRPVPHLRTRGREAHRLGLHQARHPRRRCAQPTGQSRAGVPEPLNGSVVRTDGGSCG
jgi:DNA-binding NarL/FixJ family response regulator